MMGARWLQSQIQGLQKGERALQRAVNDHMEHLVAHKKRLDATDRALDGVTERVEDLEAVQGSHGRTQLALIERIEVLEEWAQRAGDKLVLLPDPVTPHPGQTISPDGSFLINPPLEEPAERAFSGVSAGQEVPVTDLEEVETVEGEWDGVHDVRVSADVVLRCSCGQMMGEQTLWAHLYQFARAGNEPIQAVIHP